MKCPKCGGDTEYSKEDGLVVCVAPGTCTWSCGPFDDERCGLSGCQCCGGKS